MNKKVPILIISLFWAKFTFADIGYISYSDFYSGFYLITILPVLLWGSNLIIAIRTFMKKDVPSGLFWIVNCLSILLALISISPVYTDITEMGIASIEIYGFVLILLVMTPLILSTNAIRIRWKIKRNTTKPKLH